MSSVTIIVVCGFQSLFNLPGFEGTANNDCRVEFVCKTVPKYAAETLREIHLDNDVDFDTRIYYSYVHSHIDDNSILNQHGFSGKVKSFESWEMKEVNDADIKEDIDMSETLLVVIDKGGYMLLYPKNWEEILIDNKRS